MQNDNSSLGANCSMWGIDGKWGVPMLTRKTLYEAPFYWFNRYHFVLGSTSHNGRWECDDNVGGDKKGRWKYYFR